MYMYMKIEKRLIDKNLCRDVNLKNKILQDLAETSMASSKV